jgi:hypothetical protein
MDLVLLADASFQKKVYTILFAIVLIKFSPQKLFFYLELCKIDGLIRQLSLKIKNNDIQMFYTMKI